MVETFGSLTVRCTVDANVVIDGNKIGMVTANKFSKFDVPAGSHAVEITSRDGGLSWSGSTHIKAGENSILDRPPLMPTDSTVGVSSEWKSPEDNRIYKTIIIRGIEWFAENYSASRGDDAYPDNDRSKVQEYGRLYPYTQVRSLPGGWWLPSEEDFKGLIALYSSPYDALVGGKSGFNAKLAGSMKSGQYGEAGNQGAYWSSTLDGSTAWGLTFLAPTKKVSLERHNLGRPSTGQLYLALRFLRKV